MAPAATAGIPQGDVDERVGGGEVADPDRLGQDEGERLGTFATRSTASVGRSTSTPFAFPSATSRRPSSTAASSATAWWPHRGRCRAHVRRRAGHPWPRRCGCTSSSSRSVRRRRAGVPIVVRTDTESSGSPKRAPRSLPPRRRTQSSGSRPGRHAGHTHGRRGRRRGGERGHGKGPRGSRPRCHTRSARAPPRRPRRHLQIPPTTSTPRARIPLPRITCRRPHSRRFACSARSRPARSLHPSSPTPRCGTHPCTTSKEGGPHDRIRRHAESVTDRSRTVTAGTPAVHLITRTRRRPR